MTGSQQNNDESIVEGKHVQSLDSAGKAALVESCAQVAAAPSSEPNGTPGKALDDSAELLAASVSRPGDSQQDLPNQPSVEQPAGLSSEQAPASWEAAVMAGVVEEACAEEGAAAVVLDVERADLRNAEPEQAEHSEGGSEAVSEQAEEEDGGAASEEQAATEDQGEAGSQEDLGDGEVEQPPLQQQQPAGTEMEIELGDAQQPGPAREEEEQPAGTEVEMNLGDAQQQEGQPPPQQAVEMEVEMGDAPPPPQQQQQQHAEEEEEEKEKEEADQRQQEGKAQPQQEAGGEAVQEGRRGQVAELGGEEGEGQGPAQQQEEEVQQQQEEEVQQQQEAGDEVELWAEGRGQGTAAGEEEEAQAQEPEQPATGSDGTASEGEGGQMEGAGGVIDEDVQPQVGSEEEALWEEGGEGEEEEEEEQERTEDLGEEVSYGNDDGEVAQQAGDEEVQGAPGSPLAETAAGEQEGEGGAAGAAAAEGPSGEGGAGGEGGSGQAERERQVKDRSHAGGSDGASKGGRGSSKEGAGAVQQRGSGSDAAAAAAGGGGSGKRERSEREARGNDEGKEREKRSSGPSKDGERDREREGKRGREPERGARKAEPGGSSSKRVREGEEGRGRDREREEKDRKRAGDAGREKEKERERERAQREKEREAAKGREREKEREQREKAREERDKREPAGDKRREAAGRQTEERAAGRQQASRAKPVDRAAPAAADRGARNTEDRTRPTVTLRVGREADRERSRPAPGQERERRPQPSYRDDPPAREAPVLRIQSGPGGSRQVTAVRAQPHAASPAHRHRDPSSGHQAHGGREGGALPPHLHGSGGGEGGARGGGSDRGQRKQDPPSATAPSRYMPPQPYGPSSRQAERRAPYVDEGPGKERLTPRHRDPMPAPLIHDPRDARYAREDLRGPPLGEVGPRGSYRAASPEALPPGRGRYAVPYEAYEQYAEPALRGAPPHLAGAAEYDQPPRGRRPADDYAPAPRGGGRAPAPYGGAKRRELSRSLSPPGPKRPAYPSYPGEPTGPPHYRGGPEQDPDAARRGGPVAVPYFDERDALPPGAGGYGRGPAPRGGYLAEEPYPPGRGYSPPGGGRYDAPPPSRYEQQRPPGRYEAQPPARYQDERGAYGRAPGPREREREAAAGRAAAGGYPSAPAPRGGGGAYEKASAAQRGEGGGRENLRGAGGYGRSGDLQQLQPGGRDLDPRAGVGGPRAYDGRDGGRAPAPRGGYPGQQGRGEGYEDLPPPRGLQPAYRRGLSPPPPEEEYGRRGIPMRSAVGSYGGRPESPMQQQQQRGYGGGPGARERPGPGPGPDPYAVAAAAGAAGEREAAQLYRSGPGREQLPARDLQRERLPYAGDERRAGGGGGGMGRDELRYGQDDRVYRSLPEGPLPPSRQALSQRRDSREAAGPGARGGMDVGEGGRGGRGAPIGNYAPRHVPQPAHAVPAGMASAAQQGMAGLDPRLVAGSPMSALGPGSPVAAALSSLAAVPGLLAAAGHSAVAPAQMAAQQGPAAAGYAPQPMVSAVNSARVAAAAGASRPASGALALGAHAVGAAGRAAVDDEPIWYYTDPQGIQRGPHSISQFRRWLEGLSERPDLRQEYEAFKNITVFRRDRPTGVPLMMLLK